MSPAVQRIIVQLCHESLDRDLPFGIKSDIASNIPVTGPGIGSNIPGGGGGYSHSGKDSDRDGRDGRNEKSNVHKLFLVWTHKTKGTPFEKIFTEIGALLLLLRQSIKRSDERIARSRSKVHEKVDFRERKNIGKLDWIVEQNLGERLDLRMIMEVMMMMMMMEVMMMMTRMMMMMEVMMMIMEVMMIIMEVMMMMMMMEVMMMMMIMEVMMMMMIMEVMVMIMEVMMVIMEVMMMVIMEVMMMMMEVMMVMIIAEVIIIAILALMFSWHIGRDRRIIFSFLIPSFLPRALTLTLTLF